MNGSRTNASKCVYYGKNFHIRLYWVDKVEDENIGIFTFKIFPAIYNLNKLVLMNSFNFQTNRNNSVLSWSYFRGEI